MKVWLVGRNPGGLIPASCTRPVSSSLAAQVLNTFVGLGIASIVGVATWGHPYQVQSDGQIVIGLALTVTAVTSVLLLVAGLNRGMAVKRFTKVSPRRAAPRRTALPLKRGMQPPHGATLGRRPAHLGSPIAFPL